MSNDPHRSFRRALLGARLPVACCGIALGALAPGNLAAQLPGQALEHPATPDHRMRFAVSQVLGGTFRGITASALYAHFRFPNDPVKLFGLTAVVGHVSAGDSTPTMNGAGLAVGMGGALRLGIGYAAGEGERRFRWYLRGPFLLNGNCRIGPIHILGSSYVRFEGEHGSDGFVRPGTEWRFGAGGQLQIGIRDRLWFQVGYDHTSTLKGGTTAGSTLGFGLFFALTGRTTRPLTDMCSDTGRHD